MHDEPSQREDKRAPFGWAGRWPVGYGLPTPIFHDVYLIDRLPNGPIFANGVITKFGKKQFSVDLSSTRVRVPGQRVKMCVSDRMSSMSVCVLALGR